MLIFSTAELHMSPADFNCLKYRTLVHFGICWNLLMHLHASFTEMAEKQLRTSNTIGFHFLLNHTEKEAMRQYDE